MVIDEKPRDSNTETVPVSSIRFQHVWEDVLGIEPEPSAIIQPGTQTPAVANLQSGLYLIDKPRIIRATTPAYRQFLREAGYGDLDACSHLGVAKGVLKYDQAVRDRAPLNGADGTYVVSVNQTAGRDLIQALGGKLLTTALMYRLFIPYIKELAQNGNPEAQATLDEMTNTKAEWLEDLILDKTRLKIGTKERALTLPDKDGRFDRADINEFGYPDRVKQKGEFYHWHVSGDERAAIRDWGSELNLSLDGGPSFVSGGLGVRFAKIF